MTYSITHQGGADIIAWWYTVLRYGCDEDYMSKIDQTTYKAIGQLADFLSAAAMRPEEFGVSNP